LTYHRPKVLIPVLNRPLLGMLLDQLEAAGFSQVALNTHHLASQVQRFLATQGAWSFFLHLSHEPEILGTGGGLRELAKILGSEPFLAINGDILTDLDLAAVYVAHKQGALTTLVLHDQPPYNKVWLDRRGLVAGIGETPPPHSHGPPLAYTGVQVVNPAIRQWLPAAGPGDLVSAWRQALAAGQTLAALVMEGHFWQDLGTPGAYLKAHRRLQAGAAPRLARWVPSLTDPLLGPATLVGPDVLFKGGVCLGAGVVVGQGACLTNTVVWEGAVIAPGVYLENCVVDSDTQVGCSASGQVLSSHVEQPAPPVL
jgi:mannose-1-phosphate guanylyltransferase